MKEKKKRSKLGTMWDVVVDAVHEPLINLKNNEKVSVKAAGIVLGKAASIVTKPAVQLYDGVREGFNQKAPPVRDEE